MSNKGNFKPPDRVFRYTVATVLAISDYEAVKRLAAAQGVSVSTYVRSIVVDAIADEAASRGPLCHPQGFWITALVARMAGTPVASELSGQSSVCSVCGTPSD